MTRTFRLWLALVLPLVSLALPAAAQESRKPWSDHVIELFSTLPVQEGGRVKPLDTFAQFRLLRFNGRRSVTTPSGERIGPTAWLLDCLFFPEVASSYRTFLVRDQALMTIIGVNVPDRKKSDRYSFAELLPGRAKLFAEAGRIGNIDPKERNAQEAQLYNLALDVRDFGDLIHTMDFARVHLPTHESKLMKARFGDQPEPGITSFIEGVPALTAELDQGLADLSPEERTAEENALRAVSDDLTHAVEASSTMALFPSSDPHEDEWMFVGSAAERAFAGDAPEDLELLKGWEALERTKEDPTAFESALSGLHLHAVGLAERRGEYAKIPLEVSFYRADYFTRALVFFLLGFVFLCGTWLAPRNKWFVRGTWAMTSIATVLVVVGVVVRCIIRARPPVSTLYETILFITGCGMITLLVIEWIQRGRIALSLAPVLGAAGMFLSMKYELKEATLSGDTMPSLVAVLDTNFWLATHVTTVTLGYSAGLLAAALGNIWLLGKLVGFKKDDKDFYRSITRMIYGIVCFGLIFSVVGTILGGIWANYSWGRFWGWDPKENGALLICLAELFILHARMGGYVRDHGLAVLAALNGLVVAFSWWHVNNLGVGLHSYGKTEGVIMVLYTYYSLALLVVAASLVQRMLTRPAPAPTPAPRTQTRGKASPQAS